MSVILHKEKAITSNSITNEQSTKLIQTMLSMSFGCIAFLRGLFPDDSFIDQKFVPSKFEKNYDPKKADNSNSIRVKTLMKGKNPSVDLFLDWIDKGCIDSIRHGYLKSLSFAIFLHENDPNNLYEVYTFHFDYAGNQVQLGINDNIKDNISLLDSRKLLQQLMKRFIIITQSLNPLPDEKFMSMRLLFNDNCPKQYQPPLFKDASNEPTATVKCAKSHLERYVAGNLYTGYHDIKMDIMANNNVDDEKNLDEEVIEIDPFVIPKLPKKKEEPQGEDEASKYSQTRARTMDQSQTTANLKSFLQSSQYSCVATQELTDIQCECGATYELEDNALHTCSICFKKKHSSCYGFKFLKSPNVITCYTCRSKTLDLPLHENLHLLMNVRKIFNYLINNRLPDSLSEFFYNIGFSEMNKNINTACEALSYLILNHVVTITNDAFYKVASPSCVKGSYLVDIDIPNISNYTGDLFINQGKHGFQFIPLFRPSSELAAQFEQVRKDCAATKKLLFETTLSKCFSVDYELNTLTLNQNFKSESDEDTIDSSRPSSPASGKVSARFSGLQLADQIIDSSQKIPSSNINAVSSMRKHKKRGIEKEESNVKAESFVDSLNPRDYLITSQPVRPFPRMNKKRKTSVTNEIIQPSCKKC